MSFFKFLFKNKPTHTLGNRLKESGNVFMMLFGAVAMVGVIGASTMTVMKGPVRTMSQVTKRTIAENNMIAAGKLALIAATTQADNGDCDSDGMIEPIPYANAIAGFTGGGSLPATIGVAKEDPWGNEYAYCVWDHGDSGAGDPLDNDANCGGSTNFLAGGDVVTEYALAIISAGPDRHFDTTCVDFVAPGTPMINKTVGKDDLILGYTYGEASALSAGLWNIESGDPNTAEITKDLSVKDGAFEAFTLEAATGNLALGVGATGSFPSVQTDFLSAYNNANIVVNSPISSSGDITTTADVSGVDLAASGTLGVSGISTLGVVNSGNTGITGTLGVSGISTLGATNTTTLTSSAGATLNSLGVTNGASIGGTLTMGNDIILGAHFLTGDGVGSDGISIDASGDVTGSGDITATSALNSATLATTGNATIGGTLGVAGTTNLAGLNAGVTTLGATTLSGNLIMGGNAITGLADPTNPQDAATRKYVLDNIAAGTGYTETDPQVDTLTANKWCTANAAGTKIDCNVDLPGETDPQVGTLTAGRWCTTDGTDIDCTTDPATGLAGALAIDDLSDSITDYTTDFNLFMGDNAGANNPAGAQYNIAIGQNAFDDAGKTNVADRNTAIGYNALTAQTSGYYNTAIGYNTLSLNTTGNNNTASGVQALKSNTIGTENTANGSGALLFNTSGNANTASGTQALLFNTSGKWNTASGTYALRQSTLGDSNTATGFYALFQNAAGNRNTASGAQALRLNTGDNNTAIGYGAGDNINTGSNNIVIGYNIDAPVATADNQLNIGNILFGSGVGTTAGSKIGAVNYCDENLANCFIATDVGSGGSALSLVDADGDTKIQVEEGADDDTIRFDTFGVERMVIDNTGKVGIGSDTDGTLTITGAPDIASANTAGQGGLVIQDVIGDASGMKMRLDTNEIQVSDNGVATGLRLNAHGGTVFIGTAGSTALDMTTSKIVNLANPTVAQDAATKAYVDAQVGGAGDNLGNHTATADLLMGANDIRLGTSNLQKLSGDNAGSITYNSNSSSSTSIKFNDKEATYHGAIYGDADGAYFGLLDGDGNWSYQARKDVSTSFYINDIAELAIFPTYLDLKNNNIDNAKAITAATTANGAKTIFGTATGSNAYGIYGKSESTSGKGVIGWASAASGTTYGVHGLSGSPTGYGGYFFNSGGGVALKVATGGMNMSGGIINDLADPTLAQHAATKKYVDDEITAAGGASAINDLSDGKTDASSVFLGTGTGAVDDGTTNNNTAVGINALNKNTSGYRNIAIGYNSLFENTTARDNIAIGSYALNLNTTGQNNTAIGTDTLRNNTTATSNIAVGGYTLYNTTTGGQNTAIGSYVLNLNTTGKQNTAIGEKSLTKNTTGDQNTAVSRWALYKNTTGDQNTAVGHGSLYNNTIGNNNTALGSGAGAFITTGNNNIAIGYGINVPIATADNQLNIGNTIYGDLSTNEVGIGTSNPQEKLHVEGGSILNRGTGGDVIMRHGASYGFIGTSTNTDFGLRTNNIDRIRIENSGNVGIGVAGAASQKLEVNGNVLATAYFHSSDRRLKKNIETVSGLELISKLRGVTYDWKKDGSPSAGVIAQELEKVLPRAVQTDEKGMKSVDYDQIIAPLIEAVKELKLQNEALSARIKQLEEK